MYDQNLQSLAPGHERASGRSSVDRGSHEEAISSQSTSRLHSPKTTSQAHSPTGGAKGGQTELDGNSQDDMMESVCYSVTEHALNGELV